MTGKTVTSAKSTDPLRRIRNAVVAIASCLAPGAGRK
jgi:hypothetical protein